MTLSLTIYSSFSSYGHRRLLNLFMLYISIKSKLSLQPLWVLCSHAFTPIHTQTHNVWLISTVSYLIDRGTIKVLTKTGSGGEKVFLVSFGRKLGLFFISVKICGRKNIKKKNKIMKKNKFKSCSKIFSLPTGHFFFFFLFFILFYFIFFCTPAPLHAPLVILHPTPLNCPF